MEKTIQSLLQSSSDLKATLSKTPSFISAVAESAKRIKISLEKGGTIYSCGNGGSACDAMHFTEELVARFKRERKGFRAIHFGDVGMLTCWGNDYSYESAFERCAETFCTPNDVLLGISTSGKSKNVLKAFAKAKEKGTYTIGLTGKDGGEFPNSCDLSLVVPSQATERIQEAHITIIHIWCELLETV